MSSVGPVRRVASADAAACSVVREAVSDPEQASPVREANVSQRVVAARRASVAGRPFPDTSPSPPDFPCRMADSIRDGGHDCDAWSLATAAREGVLPSDLRHPSRYRSIVEPYRRRNARFLCSQAPADPVSKNPPRKAPASRLSQAPQDATSTRRKACLSARPRTARLSFRPLHPRLRGRVHLAHGPGRATFSWRRNPPPRPATGHVHLAHGGRSGKFFKTGHSATTTTTRYGMLRRPLPQARQGVLSTTMVSRHVRKQLFPIMCGGTSVNR